MLHAASVLPRRLPTLLLLGLLALLLWGQCAFSVTDSSPPPRELLVSVASTDSLRAATPTQPATLYLTLTLYNNTPRDLFLLDLHGTLDYRNQSWAWQAGGGQLLALPVPVQARRPLAIGVPLLPADSVAALQASLHTASYLPYLALAGTYARRADGRGGRYRFQTTDYLQILKAR